MLQHRLIRRGNSLGRRWLRQQHHGLQRASVEFWLGFRIERWRCDFPDAQVRELRICLLSGFPILEVERNKAKHVLAWLRRKKNTLELFGMHLLALCKKAVRNNLRTDNAHIPLGTLCSPVVHVLEHFDVFPERGHQAGRAWPQEYGGQNRRNADAQNMWRCGAVGHKSLNRYITQLRSATLGRDIS